MTHGKGKATTTTKVHHGRGTLVKSTAAVKAPIDQSYPGQVDSHGRYIWDHRPGFWELFPPDPPQHMSQLSGYDQAHWIGDKTLDAPYTDRFNMYQSFTKAQVKAMTPAQFADYTSVRTFYFAP